MMSSRILAVVPAILLSASLGRAAEVDPYLPEDTETVLNLNVRQILDSALIKKHVLSMAQEALRDNNEVQEVLNSLGFDPFKDLDRIVVASPGGTAKDRGLVIVHGRFNVAKFTAKAKEESDHVKIHKVLGGKHLLFEASVPDLDDPFFVALAGPDTLLISPGKDYIVNALKKSGKKDKTTLKSKKFQGLLENISPQQSLSLAAIKTPEVAKALEEAPGDIKTMLEKIQALGGGLTISDEFKVELVVNTKNAEDAKELGESTKAGLNLILALAANITSNNDSPPAEFAVEVIKSLRVTNKGKTVVLKGRVSSDLIEDTFKKKSK